uniref:Maspardin n=1 Tax=Romanomermis culicivorax TaxID=13658 RepID=A0A915JD61_ROMCU
VTLSDPLKIWSYFEAGPKAVKSPVLFLPPVCGAADVYFRQILNLSARGFRVIAVDYPQYWSIDAFCHDFEEFLNFKQFDNVDIISANPIKILQWGVANCAFFICAFANCANPNEPHVHIFGASLGGFLAQKFAEYSALSSSTSLSNGESDQVDARRQNQQRVASLLLCNSFSNTMVFQRDDIASLFYLLPNFILKRMLRNGFLRTKDEAIMSANNFMIDQLSLMSKEKLSSRITLSYRRSNCKTSKISSLPITIIDVFDKSQFLEMSEHLFNAYPNAKKAHIKSGGCFPFLSRCDEVNLHIMKPSNLDQ